MRPEKQLLYNDITADHRERMLNLKKYYPFFKLSEISFSWFMEGKYDNLDMGYILMAVLRFFIEENNFKERDVTYPQYFSFMSSCIKRDFGISLDEANNKVLVDYIFDKLKNEGKPFSFEYFDPFDRVKKSSRIKLLESRISDGVVHYSISPEGIEFYLDTKEIRDESKISVEQLLLEKMIRSKDFAGGTKVVLRINAEVEKLWVKKNAVCELLAMDVFAGNKAYEEFVDTGIRWFEEEQKLFVKNSELIEAALSKAESDKSSNNSESFYRTISEIDRLNTELKVAMSNHSKLLKACTELSIYTDEMIKKSKLTRLRSRFDFASTLDYMVKHNRPQILGIMVRPFFLPNIHKTFSLEKIEDILTYRQSDTEKAETVKHEEAVDIIFQDELDDERFANNVKTLMRILLELLSEKDEVTLREYHERVSLLLGDKVSQNGDYYTFLVHLCSKKEYFITQSDSEKETFLDECMGEFINTPQFSGFCGMHFVLEFPEGEIQETNLGDYATVTDFTIRKVL